MSKVPTNWKPAILLVKQELFYKNWKFVWHVFNLGFRRKKKSNSAEVDFDI